MAGEIRLEVHLKPSSLKSGAVHGGGVYDMHGSCLKPSSLKSGAAM